MFTNHKDAATDESIKSLFACSYVATVKLDMMETKKPCHATFYLLCYSTSDAIQQVAFDVLSCEQGIPYKNNGKWLHDHDRFLQAAISANSTKKYNAIQLVGDQVVPCMLKQAAVPTIVPCNGQGLMDQFAAASEFGLECTQHTIESCNKNLSALLLIGNLNCTALEFPTSSNSSKSTSAMNHILQCLFVQLKQQAPTLFTSKKEQSYEKVFTMYIPMISSSIVQIMRHSKNELFLSKCKELLQEHMDENTEEFLNSKLKKIFLADK